MFKLIYIYIHIYSLVHRVNPLISSLYPYTSLNPSSVPQPGLGARTTPWSSSTASRPPFCLKHPSCAPRRHVSTRETAWGFSQQTNRDYHILISILWGCFPGHVDDPPNLQGDGLWWIILVLTQARKHLISCAKHWNYILHLTQKKTTRFIRATYWRFDQQNIKVWDDGSVLFSCPILI